MSDDEILINEEDAEDFEPNSVVKREVDGNFDLPNFGARNSSVRMGNNILVPVTSRLVTAPNNTNLVVLTSSSTTAMGGYSAGSPPRHQSAVPPVIKQEPVANEGDTRRGFASQPTGPLVTSSGTNGMYSNAATAGSRGNNVLITCIPNGGEIKRDPDPLAKESAGSLGMSACGSSAGIGGNPCGDSQSFDHAAANTTVLPQPIVCAFAVVWALKVLVTDYESYCNTWLLRTSHNGSKLSPRF